MATPLYTFVQKTPKQVHDDGLRTLKNGLIQIGIASPNVGPNSDYDVLWTSIGNEIAVGQANAVVQADQLMPDTAAGANLDRWLTIFGIARRPAVGSFGNITITLSASSTLIPTGAQLVSTTGLRYQVITGGTYATGTLVPIQAVDTGFATNLPNGTTLTWTNAPPFSAPTATVGTVGGTDGLIDGNDSEVGVDEPPRQRLIQLLQNPPRGGNVGDIQAWALASSPYVQGVFVYPALTGPASVYFAVTAAPQAVAPFTSTSKTRALPATVVSNTVVPYVQGLLPEHVYSVGVATVDSPTDVAIQLFLPSATTASPPGPGGGWVDGSPWPTSTGGTTPVSVTAVANAGLTITVNAQTPPVTGVSHVCWISPLTWQLYTAYVVSFSGSVGAYVLTLSAPFTGIANGNYIFPQAINTQNYMNSLLTAFANMGPGEWTGNAQIIARAYRHPVPSLVWPYSLGPNQLKQVINSGVEVLDAQWLYRSQTTPAAPATVATAPNIITPRNLAFYSA
jgi:uncharacterized phage protein gp47/JayE